STFRATECSSATSRASTISGLSSRLRAVSESRKRRYEGEGKQEEKPSVQPRQALRKRRRWKGPTSRQPTVSGLPTAPYERSRTLPESRLRRTRSDGEDPRTPGSPQPVPKISGASRSRPPVS